MKAERPSLRQRRGSSQRTPAAPFFAPIALFWALIVIKAWATRWLAIADPNPLRALVLEGGIVLLALAVAAVAFGRGRLWAYLGVDALFSAIFVASAVYVSQFEQLPTPDTLGLAKQLGAVQESVLSLLSPWYALYFVDIVLFAVLFALTARSRRAVPKRRDWRLAALAAVGVVWAGVVLGVVIFGGPIADSQAGARARGMLAFQLAGSQKSSEVVVAATAGAEAQEIKEVDYKDPVSVQYEIDRLQGDPDPVRIAGAPKPGAYAGKHVIVIQLEAMMPFLIGAKFEGEEVTPNLNKLVKESWYAPSMFTEIGKGNTSDAEFVENTSLLTRRAQPAALAWGDKQIPSLPRLLAAKGYSADTFHANVVTFWTRNKLYKALGFQSYRDSNFYHDQDLIGMGASDAVFYAKTLPLIEKRAKRGPVYEQLITLSSHHPFGQLANRVTFPVPPSVKNELTGRYIKAEHYTDEQLGIFIDKMKKDGLWDDSVVVIYGDHFGVGGYKSSKAEKAVLTKLVGHEFTVVDYFRVPLIIHVPGQKKPGRIEGTVGQIDIMPTIAELIGLDTTGAPQFGRSVFVGGSPIVPLRYYAPEGTFVTDDVLFKPGIGYKDGTAQRVSDGAKIPVDQVPEELYDRAVALLGVNEKYLAALPSLPATATIKFK